MPARDLTPPSVNITSPVNLSTYLTNSTFAINVSGSDAQTGVNKINIYVTPPNGTQTLVKTQSYTAKINTTQTASVNYSVVSAGTYTITGITYDKSGNQASQSITVFANTTTTTSSSTTSSTTTIRPTLPSSKKLATPTPWNQGGEGACQAFATALACSIEKYYTTGATSYSQSTNELSPEWIFNFGRDTGGGYDSNGNFVSPVCPGCSYTNCTNPNDPSTCTAVFCPTPPLISSCGTGVTASDSFEIVRRIGIPRWSVCPFDPQNGCGTYGFTSTMRTDATLTKITNYALVVGSDIFTIKRLICNNHGIVFTFTMDSNYYNSDCNYIWNSRGSLMASHAMVIVGYDDVKQAWLAQNSWGPTWGCNGQIWINYTFFSTTVSSGNYVLTTRTDKNFYPIL